MKARSELAPTTPAASRYSSLSAARFILRISFWRRYEGRNCVACGSARPKRVEAIKDRQRKSAWEQNSRLVRENQLLKLAPSTLRLSRSSAEPLGTPATAERAAVR